jgi:hypothetical protein
VPMTVARSAASKLEKTQLHRTSGARHWRSRIAINTCPEAPDIHRALTLRLRRNKRCLSLDLNKDAHHRLFQKRPRTNDANRFL